MRSIWRIIENWPISDFDLHDEQKCAAVYEFFTDAIHNPDPWPHEGEILTMASNALGETSMIQRVRDFSRSFPAMTNDELFQALRWIQATRTSLASDAEQFEEFYWKGVNAEVEIAGRFPDKQLLAYQEWLTRVREE